MTEIVIGPGIDPDIKFDGLVPGLKYDSPFDFKVEIGRWDDVQSKFDFKFFPKVELPRDELPQFEDRSEDLLTLSKDLLSTLSDFDDFEVKFLETESQALKFIKITVSVDDADPTKLIETIGAVIGESGLTDEVDARFQGGGKFYEIKLFDVAVPPAEQEPIITGMDDLFG